MKTYKYTIDGKEYEVAIGDVVDNIANVTVNGVEYNVEMEQEPECEKKVVIKHVPQETAVGAESATTSSGVDMTNALKSPLPGVITEVMVSVGDEVKKGDTVIVLEAMKMANNIEAEKDGKVVAICVKAGENVMEDTSLVVIE